jgi:hypothetical protein
VNPVRFLWLATRGHRLAPWTSPYLRWRIETFSGIPAASLTPAQFWKFVWEKRTDLLRYLRWVGRNR